MLIKSRQTTFLWVLLLAIFVLAFRMIFERALPLFQDQFNLYFSDFLFDLLRNFPLTLLMVVSDFLLVKLLTKYFEYGLQPVTRTTLEVGGICLIALCSTLLVRTVFDDIFLFTLFTSFIFNAVLVTAIDLFTYYGWAHKKALAVEIKKSNKASYQYQQLKRQLNPHFLFNSLNVLDYLIHTNKEKASNYVKQMAAVYRYLLNIENQTLVELEDEVVFVRLYVDLLLERFDKGLKVSINIDPSYLKKKVIPCGLQVLVENAVKHNIISPEQVLYISITVEGDYLITRNNLQPKMHRADSTGLGLNNIRRQYQSLCNKTIIVSNDMHRFEVRVPLVD